MTEYKFYEIKIDIDAYSLLPDQQIKNQHGEIMTVIDVIDFETVLVENLGENEVKH